MPDDSDDFLSDEDYVEILSRRESARKGLAPSTSTLHLNQLKRFLFEMSIGDWLVTMRASSVRIGRVVGPPQIVDEPIILYDDNDPPKESRMPYRLRRRIAWGPTLQKTTLPYSLASSLQAHQTVFNIDDRWEAICHSLYPVFKKGAQLYLSARIRNDSPIANIDLIDYLRYVSEIEFLAKQYQQIEDDANIDALFREFARSGGATLSTKAAFQSPGEIAHTVITSLTEGGVRRAFLIWSLYSMAFGNDLVGVDGIIDLESRQRLWGIAADRIETWGARETIEKYDIVLPASYTVPLESDALDGECLPSDGNSRAPNVVAEPGADDRDLENGPR